MRKRLSFILFALALLFVLPAAAYESASANILYNADFLLRSEGSVLPAGWYYDAWMIDDSEYNIEYDDASNAILSITNNLENDARICQLVTVNPNTAYRFSCEILAENVAGGAGAALSVLDTFVATDSLYTTDGWQEVSFTGVTAADQTQLIVAMRVGGYGDLSTGTARFRNLSVTALADIPLGAQSLAIYTGIQDGGGLNSSVNWPGIILSCVISAVLLGLFYTWGVRRPTATEKPEVRAQLAGMVLAAVLLRCICSLIFVGHSTDINCFAAWADAMVTYGPSGFYTSGMFADYPPGYMYILWAIGSLQRLFGLHYSSAVFLLLLKLPAMLADMALATIVYRVALRRGVLHAKALLLFALVALNPVSAFLTGGWGQIDSILTLCLVGVCLLFLSGKPVWAGAVYGLAILLKPQALMAGPLLAAAYLLPESGVPYGKRIGKAALSVLAAVTVLFLLALPFNGGQDFTWLYDKYFSTATSYPYASVEAFNFFSMIGGNWARIESIPFLFSYGSWGILFILCSVSISIFLYAQGRKQNKQGALFLTLGFMLVALFALGPYMHERYIYPALLLLLLAGIYYDDRRPIALSLYFSVTLFFNALCAFYIVDHQDARGQLYDALTVAGSFLTMAGFGYLVYTVWDILLRGRTRATAFFALAAPDDKSGFTRENCMEDTAAGEGAAEGEGMGADAGASAGARAGACPIRLTATDTKLGFTKRDRLYCLGLTLVYAVFALVNLGSLQAPETEYESIIPGQTLEIAFDGEEQLNEFWIFGGIAEGSLLLETDSGEQITFEQVFDDMFRWKRVIFQTPVKSMTLMTYSGSLRIRELAFFNTDGIYIQPQYGQPESAALFDEPHTIPAYPGYYNGMYFDELYHGRTAYEHLHGLSPYENSHPPLGKVFIMLGIAIFGMNPFGWRIVGALFGVGMVPLFYCFGKRLFKKPEYALLTALLFAFDFMHFTQTRIATIDVYGVFFILLMYYYMYRYYSMSFYADGLYATLKPLGIAGIFFGLGAASKWICIYAGGGLAVLLALSLFRRYREYRCARRANDAALMEKTAAFPKYCIQTLLWCCLFYIAVPVVIYVASYTPYFFSERAYGLSDVWSFQEYMWDYHSNLQATHPFQSTWWEWPFTLRPMWYFMGEYVPGNKLSTLTASGNPAVWWVCTVLSLGLVVQRVRGRIQHAPGMTVAFVGVLANYLPWVLVTRCTFIYHFFATVPFVLLCSVYLLKHYEERNEKLAWVKWAWMGACLLLFLLLYPGLSGYPVSYEWARLLSILPGGNLMYGV